MSEAAHEVYSKLLFPKKHGYPLWIPEPQNNLPDEYRRDGVTIGDVGIVTHDGGWDVLFNICLPAEHPLNARRPGCFQQIELDPGDTFDTPDFFPQSCVIGSKSIDARAFDMAGSLEMAPVGAPVGLGAGYQFSSSSNEGAMLVLPEGGHRQDHQNVAIFFDQALQHGVAWYKYAKETRGRRIPNDNALYLITGWDKAKSWALGAYSGTSAGGSFSAKFTATQVASGDISNTYFWEKSGPSTMRVGPRHRFAEGYHGRENQGAFIRGLKIAMKSRFLLRRYVEVSTIQAAREIVRRPISGSSSALKSSATSHSGSSSQPGSSTALYRRANAPSDDETGLEVTIDPIGSLSETYHPSDVINKCLLDSFPDAELAITHDKIWCDALHEDLPLPQDSDIIVRVLELYSPARRSGCVYLLPRKHSGAILPDTVVDQSPRGIDAAGNTSRPREQPGYTPLYETVTQSPRGTDTAESTSRPKKQQAVTGSSKKAPTKYTLLNNLLQSRGGSRHNFLRWEEVVVGPQHDPQWTVICYVYGVEYGRATARYKPDAKEQAAGRAIKALEAQRAGMPAGTLGGVS